MYIVKDTKHLTFQWSAPEDTIRMVLGVISVLRDTTRTLQARFLVFPVLRGKRHQTRDRTNWIIAMVRERERERERESGKERKERESE